MKNCSQIHSKQILIFLTEPAEQSIVITANTNQILEQGEHVSTSFTLFKSNDMMKENTLCNVKPLLSFDVSAGMDCDRSIHAVFKKGKAELK